MEKGFKFSGNFYLSERQVVILCLVVMGFSHREIAGFNHISLSSAKKECGTLCAFFNVRYCRRLAYTVQLEGFDIYGCYKGKNVLPKDALDKLKKEHTWVKLKQGAKR